MQYPSIISQPGKSTKTCTHPHAAHLTLTNYSAAINLTLTGSSSRNVGPITERLALLLSPTRPGGSPDDVDRLSQPSTTAPLPESERFLGRILEVGSFPYEHISAFAREFDQYEWWGSGRDQGEIDSIHERLDSATASDPVSTPSNLCRPLLLDIASEADWARIAQTVPVPVPVSVSTRDDEPAASVGIFTGVLMINIIHCLPQHLPERVFQHCSPSSPSSPSAPSLLAPTHGWIAAYGPFKADDGTYLNPADKEFDTHHIRATHPSLGLRTIASLDAVAVKWGFSPGERHEMPKGNMWVVWRASSANTTTLTTGKTEKADA